MSIHMEFFESCQSIITNLTSWNMCACLVHFLVKLESDHKKLVLAFIHAI